MLEHLPTQKVPVVTNYRIIIINQNNYKSMKKILFRRLFVSFPQYKKLLKIMKLTVLLILVGTLVLNAATTYSQETKISLILNNVKIKEVLQEIKKKSDFSFWYSNNELNDKIHITLAVKDQTIDKILDIALRNQNLVYEIKDKFILIYKSSGQNNNQGTTASQQKKIIGIVTDAATGETISGAIVHIEGTSIGVVTDGNGKFSLDIPKPNSVVVVSFLGYNPARITVNGQTSINIKLVPDITKLDEVVVVGYGTTKKSDLTGSISSISTDKFAQQNVSRIDQALQGRTTGVQVTNVGGAPGGDVRIRIRGVNSALGSNDPLYVVDGFVGADFTLVNPNDIESIQVLKDAASTAIYGSRGSNGVIIVTTKKGKKGSVQFNYQGQIGLSTVVNKFNLMNAADFAQVVNEKNAAIGLGPAYTQTQINGYKENGGTDWQKEIYRTALTNEHQLGIMGGTDKTTFLVSGNALNQEGIVKNSSYDRYMLRSNLTTQLNDKLSFRINLTGSSMVNENSQIQSGTGNPLVQALAWAPTTPVYDANGNFTLNDPVGSLKSNPVALRVDRDSRVERSSANAIGGLRYEFIKGLALDLQYAVNYLHQETKTFNGNYVTNFTPTASIASIKQMTLQGTNSLSFNRVINGVHSINAVAVFETQQFTQNSFNANSSGLKFPDLKYDNLAQAATFTVGSDFSKWTLMSFLGRVNYTFREKYLLSVSIRRDGSSKFQSNNKYSTFPALAVGWNLTNEDFIKKINLFSLLKVRASWGWTGSQAIQPYATESTYSSINMAFNNNNLTSGIRLGNPGNRDLKWETTEQKDIGAEIGLFKGRLTAEFDYFIKNTTDLLLNRPLPSYAGGGVYASNVGEIENKGWEFSLGGTLVDLKNFKWKSDFNISGVENTVVSLGGIADMIFTGSNVGAAYSTQSEFVYQPGKPLGSYWGLRYLGTWKPNEAAAAAKFGMAPGDAKYEDLDKNNVINNSDYQIIGCGLPKTTAGWNNTFTFKNITLNVFFQGVFGIDKLDYTRASALVASGDNRQATLVDIKDRYIPGVNETSNIPAFSKSNKTICQSTMFMENGDFIRLKNLSLAYNIPSSALWNLASVRVSLNATNLLTITKYKGLDPEASSVGSGSDLNQSIDYGAYPNAKTFTLGINITF